MKTRGKAKPAGARAPGKASAKKSGAKAKSRRSSDSLDALVDASARALDLPLEPAWRPAVKGNLDVTLRLAALFTDFPLPDDAEPAPVFVA